MILRSLRTVDQPFRIGGPVQALRVSTLWAEPKFIPMPDGERFAFVQSVEETPKVERLEVVLNWDAGLDGVRD